MISKPIKKYYDSYCDLRSKRWATEIPDRKWSVCLVIPLCCEEESISEQLTSLFEQTQRNNTLVIYIINNAPFASNETVEANRHTLEKIARYARWTHTINGSDWSLFEHENMSFLVIDSFSDGKRMTGGVGEARKILGDLALSLFVGSKLTTSQVFMSDGDATFPTVYLSYALAPQNALGIFPFVHDESYVNTEIAKRAVRTYDCYLHYYVHMLAKSGSPYAFYTLGSLLVFDLEAYTKVRGFPKREAGEDFYFINKMAKVGAVEKITDKDWTITLQGRISERVPFGTGPAVKKIISMYESGQEYFTYSPKVFKLLETWLQFAETTIRKSSGFSLDQSTHNFLLTNDYLSELDKIQNAATTPERRLKTFHDWFDAFRTLKFIHSARDQLYPNEPLTWERPVSR